MTIPWQPTDDDWNVLESGVVQDFLDMDPPVLDLVEAILGLVQHQDPGRAHLAFALLFGSLAADATYSGVTMVSFEDRLRLFTAAARASYKETCVIAAADQKGTAS